MSDESVKSMKELYNEFLNDPDRCKELMRKVLGSPHRVLEGKEKEEIWLLLQLMEPAHTSNNQVTVTEVYYMSGKEYRVTYIPGSQTVIDELLPEEP